MNKLLIMSSLIATMSLGSITTAQAKPLKDAGNANLDLPQPSYLIASPFREEISPAHQRRSSLMKMLVLQMEMNELAEDAMASDDPELKTLAAEMLESSDKMTSQLLKLIQSSPRSGQFSR